MTTTYAPASLTTPRAWTIEVLFIGSTVLLPIVAHMLSWPVLWTQPIFWGVMIAGLVYGWKGGLIAGIAAPLLNNVLTGMPPAPILPAMVVEMVMYGLIPGVILRMRPRTNPMLALAAGILTGRLLLVTVWASTSGSVAGIGGFAAARLLPGIPVNILQILLVPVIASWLRKVVAAGDHSPDER